MTDQESLREWARKMAENKEAAGYLERDAQLRPLIEELVKAASKVVDHYAFVHEGMKIKSPGAILIGENLAAVLAKAKAMGFGKEA